MSFKSGSTQATELNARKINEIERIKLLAYIGQYAWDQDQIDRAMAITNLGKLREIINEIDQWYL